MPSLWRKRRGLNWPEPKRRRDSNNFKRMRKNVEQMMKDENARKKTVSLPKRKKLTKKRLYCSLSSKNLQEKKKNAKKKSFVMS